MNLPLVKSICAFVLFVLITSSNACAGETNNAKYDKENTPDCISARKGVVSDSDLANKSKQEVAHLFNCAVSIKVADPNETKTQRKLIVERKTRLADKLLSLEMDVQYTDYSNSTLLDVVIMSHLPEEWKEKAVKVLLEKGVDEKHINQYGKDAKFYAIQSGNQTIVNLVSAVNPKP